MIQINIPQEKQDNEKVCINKDRENAWLCVGCKYMAYDKYDFYPTCGNPEVRDD